VYPAAKARTIACPSASTDPESDPEPRRSAICAEADASAWLVDVPLLASADEAELERATPRYPTPLS
jgi:hypothetical protein